eukprot:CAMPEP_0179215856 /NCGR_PEP_ID=MMETSP0797-20121207/3076_1 /TAXON_ID=47934 /ORGANISM="Dinophysis acuminata, Strain DAEP01" /LENGTH=41 /DNA_ID= /DNA_START= /DNA_END= /DNA_ORIENTATION=
MADAHIRTERAGAAPFVPPDIGRVPPPADVGFCVPVRDGPG